MAVASRSALSDGTDIQLQRASDADRLFAEALIHSNMASYYQSHGLEWQHELFVTTWPKLENYLILCQGSLAGIVCFSRDAAALYIRDLHLVPEFIGKGIGSWVIEQTELMARASGYGRLRLKVFMENPAIALYERHGFSGVGNDGVMLRMELAL